MAQRRSVTAQSDDDDIDDRFLDEDDEDIEEEDLEDDESDEDDDDLEDDSGTEQSAFDWDSDDNPYKARFEGLFGSLQYSQERVQQLEMAMIETEATNFEERLRAADIPDQQKEAIRQAFLTELAGKWKLSQAQASEARANEAAKKLAIIEIGRRHGLTKTQMQKMIGNSVPPLAMAALGMALLR